MRLWRVVVIVWVVGMATSAWAQPVVNPTTVQFSSADHARLSQYELGYFASGAADPISTYTRTPAQVIVEGSAYAFTFPRLLFGTFDVKVRACALDTGGTTLCSAWATADKQAAVTPLAVAAVTLR